jgi:hypothetical protein
VICLSSAGSSAHSRSVTFTTPARSHDHVPRARVTLVPEEEWIPRTTATTALSLTLAQASKLLPTASINQGVVGKPNFRASMQLSAMEGRNSVTGRWGGHLGHRLRRTQAILQTERQWSVPRYSPPSLRAMTSRVSHCLISHFGLHRIHAHPLQGLYGSHAGPEVVVSCTWPVQGDLILTSHSSYGACSGHADRLVGGVVSSGSPTH